MHLQTHEEAITSIVAASIPLSYKRLPIRLYQVYDLCFFGWPIVFACNWIALCSLLYS